MLKIYDRYARDMLKVLTGRDAAVNDYIVVDNKSTSQNLVDFCFLRAKSVNF